jgi:glucose-6-phosphatase
VKLLNVVKFRKFLIKISFRFSQFEEFLGFFSTLFGATSVYFILIPILAAFNTKLYHRMIISCAACDFINLSMKWIINEDRPYWWVNETKVYTLSNRPHLYQTERTCETSPGSPSGHLMLASCFCYLIYQEVNKVVGLKMKILSRFVLIAMLTFTAISRMYFAAHFLHQCLFGSVLGILIIKWDLAGALANFRKSKWFVTIFGMASFVTSTYWIFKLLSINPMKSVDLAFLHCSNPKFPRPETTIVFTAVRSISIAFGILINTVVHNAPISET